ncbi:MAG: hypothetical protein M9911_15660 [Saprospiraceae bacterium]|nr:hypothetical protein [Saprospiraceae bacterium]
MKFGCSPKTIQRKIDRYIPVTNSDFDSVANVIMDTTYFGRKFGVMVFKDSLSNRILYKCYVKYETNQQYMEGIKEISRRGICVQSIICDGRKGLFQLFGDIPVQMCQFHQVQIINRYLTRKPKIPAAIELRQLALELSGSNKEVFNQCLNQWQFKWKDFLKERTINADTGKSYYTHKRLRSAWLSLKRNLPWLFVYEDYKELMMHPTTNALDGVFADLKNKLRNHNGLSMQRKKRFIDGFFEA